MWRRPCCAERAWSCPVSAGNGPRARFCGLDAEIFTAGVNWSLLATKLVALSPGLPASRSWKAWCRSVPGQDSGGQEIRISTFWRWSEWCRGGNGFPVAVYENREGGAAELVVRSAGAASAVAQRLAGE